MGSLISLIIWCLFVFLFGILGVWILTSLITLAILKTHHRWKNRQKQNK